MRAMILCAGRGERLRPLTDSTPKPLIEVGGKPLVCWHIQALASAGFREIVINQGHLGEQLPVVLGHGEQWGVNLHFSSEPESALETGGGIFQALPLLGPSPFLVVNGDIWTDLAFARMRSIKCDQAHLVLVPNPEAHDGDFSLQSGRIHNTGPELKTFSGIAVYHPRMFEHCHAGRFSVVPLLRKAAEDQVVTGECHTGRWFDAGTHERLDQLRGFLEGIT